MGLNLASMSYYLGFVKHTSVNQSKNNIIVGQKVNSTKKQLSRNLRKQMTPAEKTLWTYLRYNKLDGLHFRRQQVIDGVVTDFYCHKHGLVVEVDGAVHENQKEYDDARSKLFEQRNLTVVRFGNNEVLNDIDAVLLKILDSCKSK